MEHLVIPVRIPAWVFLGLWLLYELIGANYGLTLAHANRGGGALFATSADSCSG